MIELAAKATGRSIRQLAANAGISDTRWRHVVKGWQPGRGGVKVDVRAPALTLARMAAVVGVDPDDLAVAGRDDASALMAKLQRNSPGDTFTIVGEGESDSVFIRHMNDSVTFTDSATAHVTAARAGGPDEIDLIYASSMPAREKLVRIRQVLELRALAEAEEAQEREKAPAEAEAEEAQDAESQQS